MTRRNGERLSGPRGGPADLPSAFALRRQTSIRELPLPVRRDVRGIFPSYRQACEEADVALLAVGDMQRVGRATQRSTVGKRTPSAIYVHESALDALPPLLRLYEGCARRYIGRIEEANVIKLHTLEPMISYLSYPEFDSDPHPALAQSLVVHLQTFKLREREYGNSKNPPILHRKETFLTSDHPLHTKFSRLTRQEEEKGLFEDTARIGTREGWDTCAGEQTCPTTRAPTDTRQEQLRDKSHLQERLSATRSNATWRTEDA